MTITKTITILFLFLSRALALAQADSSLMVLRDVNIIDGISDEPLLRRTVVISQGKIVSIQKPQRKVPANAVIFELKGNWIMPGFVDAHVHFGNVESARSALALGATTVRTMHCDHFLDVKIRDDHRAGRRDLPDVIAAGYQMRPDMFPSFFEDFPELSDMKTRVTGTDNVRRIVKALVSRRVDHIKFLATERAGTPETDPRKRTFTDEEIDAIVDEAKKAGLYAAAHAHGEEGAYAAVRAGVRSIEHGTFVSDTTLALMKIKGTYFVPTFTGGMQQPSRVEDRNNPILIERRKVGIPLRNKLILKAIEMKIPIAAGTDLRYTNRELSMADEAIFMQQAGVETMMILKAMTNGSATCLGINGRTGAIKEGLEADILILESNPLTSLGVIKNISMIFNNGSVVRPNDL